MTLRKDFPIARRGSRTAVIHMLESTDMQVRKVLTERELREVMQAHFRRFVSSARLTQDSRTGEPVVEVEFDSSGKVS